MPTPLSEIIEYLSYSSTLAPGTEYITIKVLLQEFSSLSSSVSSDQNISFTLLFLNDGVNIDYDSVSAIIANKSTTVTSAILGKWCKIRLFNATANTATIRMSTYCQVVPIAMQNQLTREGNVYPSVNVDNFTTSLYNDLHV